MDGEAKEVFILQKHGGWPCPFPSSRERRNPIEKEEEEGFYGATSEISYLSSPPLLGPLPPPLPSSRGCSQKEEVEGRVNFVPKNNFPLHYGAGNWKRWNRLGVGRPIFASHFYGRDSFSSFFFLFPKVKKS